ncbi:MAG TPA: glycosyltransferase family 1 protein [Candidatus Saccharibacteria bacterium]|nr:glycosyltransferase family 1 protein [Candidatus Saccharibacteria bacterium]
MSKKKIFIEAASIAEERFSGVGNTTINIVRELARDKKFCETFSLVLLVPFNKTHNLDRWKLAPHIAIKKVWVPGKLMNLFVRLGFMPYMDVFFGKGVYLFPNFKNWPLLYSRSINYIHDIAFKRHPEYIEDRNLSFLENNLEKWLKRTDIAACVSEYSKRELDEFYPQYRYKSRVIYNGVDVDEFYPRDKREQKEVCNRFGLIPKQYFMFFSNIEPRKNVEGLLNGYEAFRDANKNMKTPLILVGGMGWKNERILHKVEDLNKKGYGVIIPDRFVTDEEVPALLSGAIAMVHPTHYEGFGLPQLQTLACGTTLISSKNTSLPEVLANEPLYIDKDDPFTVAKAMRKAYDQRNVLNESGIKHAQKFTWSKSLKPLKDIIIELSNR